MSRVNETLTHQHDICNYFCSRVQLQHSLPFKHTLYPLHIGLFPSVSFPRSQWSTICSGSHIEAILHQVGDLGYASELGNYAEYSGAPNEEEVLQYARVVIDVRVPHLHPSAPVAGKSH